MQHGHHREGDEWIVAAGGSKTQEAAKDAASAVKSAVPDQPKEAAKTAASAAKDSLPEPPKDIPNPFQSIFGEAAGMRSSAFDFASGTHV